MGSSLFRCTSAPSIAADQPMATKSTPKVSHGRASPVPTERHPTDAGAGPERLSLSAADFPHTLHGDWPATTPEGRGAAVSSHSGSPSSSPNRPMPTPKNLKTRKSPDEREARAEDHLRPSNVPPARQVSPGKDSEQPTSTDDHRAHGDRHRGQPVLPNDRRGLEERYREHPKSPDDRRGHADSQQGPSAAPHNRRAGAESDSQSPRSTDAQERDPKNRPQPPRSVANAYATDEEHYEMLDAFYGSAGINQSLSLEMLKKVNLGAQIRILPTAAKNVADRNDYFYTAAPFPNDPSRTGEKPVRTPVDKVYVDKWDDGHLRMPCSPRNRSGDGKQRWSIICEQLTHLKDKCSRRTVNSENLKYAIEACSERRYDLRFLEQLLHVCKQHEFEQFMYTTLPGMCELVLSLENTFTEPPPLLRIGRSGSVSMTQRQVASLVACSFFCLMPTQHLSKNFQNPNFDTLYEKGPPSKLEKLKCIVHYFHRIVQNPPSGMVTFKRYVLPNDRFPEWKKMNLPLSHLTLTKDRKIEDIPATLQVDFANEYIGGGVLDGGCVQEEIRFSICPEMIASLLLCEVMQENECIFLIGCERYAAYRGYSNTFQFAGDYNDKTPTDESGIRSCHVVAMDAIYFAKPATQYAMSKVQRELLKAYTSFQAQESGDDFRFPIATGNWGCGAFNGDRELKAIIQLMAASAAQRQLIYAAFGDRNLVESFANVYTHLKNHNTTVDQLYRLLDQYSNRYEKSSLFEYILRTVTK